MPVKPVVGGTFQGAMITAVHLHADPLYPDEPQGVVLGWLAHKDEYAVWTVSGSEYVIMNGRYPKTLERAVYIYSQLVASTLHGYACVPTPDALPLRPEES